MKLQHVLGGMALGLAALSVSFPANAARDTSLVPITGVEAKMPLATDTEQSFEIAKQGRGGDDSPGQEDNHGGRGGGNDDGNRGDHGVDDANTDDNLSGSGRDKPRIPGGSGCDDPGDVLEHADCRP